MADATDGVAGLTPDGVVDVSEAAGLLGILIFSVVGVDADGSSKVSALDAAPTRSEAE